MTTTQPRFCQLCANRLIGAYTQYSSGLVVCATCERTHPHCRRCGQPALALDQHQLCKTCQQTAQRCDLCGAPLIGSYVTYNDSLTVCAQCERTAAKCAHCQRPMRKDEPGRFCQKCLADLPTCAICATPLSGKYFRFGDSPRTYCPNCAADRPRCGVCGAPVGNDGQLLPGKHYRCAECASTLVLDEHEVLALYQQIIQQTQTLFEGQVHQVPVLVIAQAEELASVRNKHHDAHAVGPASKQVVGFFEQWNNSRTIYVEYGLPKATLLGTLAHEFAHAWQADHAPTEQAHLLREGFAEWVSYRLLVALGHTREAARATRREDDYGQGLRHFISLEQRFGRPRVFAEARATITKSV